MFAVVDLETTGGNPGTDKIIEIAIYIHDGEKIVDYFSSLVNPEVPIPVFIARLTRISDEMVSSAPLFSEIAEQVHAFLADHIFVAHNVMFDYSFLAFALQREGFPYEKKMLCTCKTSRMVFPGHPSYSLSKICNSLQIELKDAHRASADAYATAILLDKIIKKQNGSLDAFYNYHVKPKNHSKIPDQQLELLPSKAGVLYFADDNGNVIYVTKSSNLRKKAASILSKLHTKRFAGIAASATSIDFETTGGVLLAAIREIESVDAIVPRFNRRISNSESRFSVYETLGDNGFLMLHTAEFNKARQPLVTFSNEKEARLELAKVCAEFGLFTSKEMLSHKPELFDESPDSYNEKVVLAIDKLKSYRKNFLIADRGKETDHVSMVVIKDGIFTGYIHLDRHQAKNSVDEMLEMMKPSNDHPSIFKSIVRHVSQGKYQKIINF
ncbi:MAG: hypothetical protein IPI23_03705 [Bacteroidetes bacterium]|nr:hypothetical protein [Bacteroidota bacterium]